MGTPNLDPPTRDRPKVLLIGTASQPDAGPLAAAAQVSRWNLHIERGRSAREAMGALRRGPVDLVVIDHDACKGKGHRLAWAARAANPSAAILVVGEWPESATASNYLRHSIAEWVAPSLWRAGAVTPARIVALVAAAVASRGQRDRLSVLECACRRLSKERAVLESKVGSLCATIAEIEAAARDREGIVSMQAECRMLLSQEVEAEPLVEIAANYLVSHTGPTNAALFVREDGQFRLAAYIRDDLARRSAGGMLEHLSAVWCAKIGQREAPVNIGCGDAVPEGMEAVVGVLPGRAILAIPCLSGAAGSVEAVVILFRDAQRPYGPDAERAARAVSGALGAALSRVCRIHNRAKPSWPTEAPEPDDSTHS